MKTTVYKTIYHRRDGKLVSMVALGKAKKSYKPGVAHRAPKWLAAEGYHLIAFDSFEDAQFFAGYYAYHVTHIWECEATGLLRNLPDRCDAVFLNHGKLEKHSTIWPKGTVMCKTLKLVKEVK